MDMSFSSPSLRLLLFFLFPMCHAKTTRRRDYSVTQFSLNRSQMTRTGIISPTRFPSFKPQLCRGGGDASFMEQLLLHCATAIDSNDAALAHQLLWVLNNIAPPDGDTSTQRLTSAFVRALLSRAASKNPTLFSTAFQPPADETHRFSVVELAGFIDLTPWHRFGFIAANEAILTAVEGYSTVHIVDLSLTHCMQIPTLIDAMANKLNKPPLLKLTVVSFSSNFPPFIDVSYEELGAKLVNFATTRNIEIQFTIIPSTYSDGFSSLLENLRIYPASHNEALVVNCHMMLSYIPDETLTPSSLSLRNVFLNQLRSLNPTIVTLIEEDVDLTSEDLVARLRSAFNYFWIPFDTTDTFVSEQRRLYEAEIRWKIDNVVAKEGVERVERTERKERWIERMRDSEFGGVRVREEAVSDLKAMIGEHAVGWG